MHRIAFAQALKASDKEIDKKICGKSHSSASGKGTAGHCNNVEIQSHSTKPIDAADLGLLSILGAQGAEKWPKIAGSGSTDSSNAYTVDGSSKVAEDMTALPKDDKVVVAGHLAKSIEGGEVVEIRSVSSTSVMVLSDETPKTTTYSEHLCDEGYIRFNQ